MGPRTQKTFDDLAKDSTRSNVPFHGGKVLLIALRALVEIGADDQRATDALRKIERQLRMR